MIHLYRIQRIDNPHVGCFRGHRYDTPANLAERHGFRMHRHPPPAAEGRPFECGQEFCAWADFRQFETWFETPAQRAAVLSHPEYEFVCITATTAIHLPRQSIFRYTDVVEYSPCEYVETASSYRPEFDLSFLDPTFPNPPQPNMLIANEFA